MFDIKIYLLLIYYLSLKVYIVLINNKNIHIVHLTPIGFLLLLDWSDAVSRQSWRSAGDLPRFRCLPSPPLSTSDLQT